MSVRLKLLLAVLPLVLALALVGLGAVLTVTSLGETSARILHDNYRSVLSAQRMKESIERMDSAALFRVGGAPERADALIAVHRAAFESELVAQERNLTEAGEEHVTARLRMAWTDYLAMHEALGSSPSAASYFAELEPRFVAVKDTADELLTLNQEAMARKSDAARRTAERARLAVIASAIVAMLLGVASTLWIGARVLRPLARLSNVAHRLGEGELSARAEVTGTDEIAVLAREFDEMAARLELFRNSSLGQLLEAQLASQAAIDSLPDPVVVFGRSGDISASNRAAVAELGLGRNGPTARHEVEPRLRVALERARDHVLSGAGPFVPRGFEDAIAVGGDDGERWYLPRASPVHGERGQVTGVTVVVQDITRLRRFDELRNDMIATVAHEFRTPLTSLRMAVLLCIEGELDATRLSLLEAARGDCERLQRMVDDLLDLARLQSGVVELDREPVAPTSLIEQAIGAHRGQADRVGITLRNVAVPQLPEVLVDRSRIQLVLDNFVVNALRHARRGSTIALSAEPHPDGVRLAVADGGPGVPEEHRARVFDRFYRIPGEATPGAGLGLSIAREVVEAHGGRIGVTATRGGGATFWFTLRGE